MQIRTLHIEELQQVAIYHQPTEQLYFYDNEELELIDSLTLTTSDPDLLAVCGDYLVNVLQHNQTVQIFQLSTRSLICMRQFDHFISAVSFTTASGLILGTSTGQLVRINYKDHDNVTHTIVSLGDSPQSGSGGMVCAVAAAPCGENVVAVVQQSSIGIYQDEVKVHDITCCNVDNIAWHFSSTDLSRQSLAVVVDNNKRLMVWSINVGKSVKKIRNVENCTMESGFVKWVKGGQVVSWVNDGLALTDVKTKNVVSRRIPIDKINALDVHSPTSRCWIVAKDELCLYSLVTGLMQESAKLPECATICEGSPVVRLTKAKVSAITIKKSPKKYSLKSMFKPQYQDSYTSSSSASSSDEYSPIITPTRGFSVDSVSTLDGGAGLSPTLSLSKYVETSLFPDVVTRLLYQPRAVMPIGHKQTHEEYLVQSLFNCKSINEAVEAQLATTDLDYNVQLKALATGEYKYNQTPSPGSSPTAVIHHTAAMHILFKQPELAKETYLRHGFYLEALVVALLYKQDFSVVLLHWCRHAITEEKPILTAIQSQLQCSVQTKVCHYHNLAAAIPNYSRPSLVKHVY